MIVLPFQILCNSGWKDITTFQIQCDKPAAVHLTSNTFCYKAATGLFIVKCNFKINSFSSDRYNCINVSEPSFLCNGLPVCNNTSGTIAPRFSKQFFEQVTKKDALAILNEYVIFDEHGCACLTDVNYGLADQLMQLSIHCGINSIISFTDNVLDLPKMYFGYQTEKRIINSQFQNPAPLAGMITAGDAVIVRTLHNNQYSAFVCSCV